MDNDVKHKFVVDFGNIQVTVIADEQPRNGFIEEFLWHKVSKAVGQLWTDMDGCADDNWIQDMSCEVKHYISEWLEVT